MRTARHDQAAVLYANMYCPISVYPIGFALSDLETYYRAGTFQTGLMKLTQTVGKAEADAKANQDSNKPAPTVEAKAKLDANATEAITKADTKTQSERAGAGLAPMAACKAPAGIQLGSDRRFSNPLASKRSPSPTTEPATNVAGKSAPRSAIN
jgi:hypothetical protein